MEEQKCRSWEEEMYWKHFNSVQFCHILNDDFHDRLVLAQKFGENMITELPDKVSLLGPSGAIWNVTLTKTNNVAFVGDGWKEFVKAYALKAYSLLMFKYKRNVGFEVLIFDPVSLCEQESAYFVKKNEKRTSTTDNHEEQEKKRSSDEAFDTELIEDDEHIDDESDVVISKRVRKDTEDPTWVGEINNKRTPRKCSTGRVKRGGNQGRGKPMNGIKSATMQNGNEGAEEHISPDSGEGNLEIVQSPRPNETSGKKTNGKEPVEELNSPENGGKNLEIVQSLKCCETKGKKKKRSGAANEQHGTNQEVVHSPKSVEVIGNTSNESEVSKEQNSPEIEGRTPEIHACKCSGARGRPRKQSAPKSKSLVYENVLLGNKSDTNDAAKEPNGLETGASAPEMVCSDNSGKTKARSRRKITPTKLKQKSDSAKGRLSKEYAPNRRPVTEKERENAMQRAQQGLTERSFITVMRPMDGYRRFYLSIPSHWAHAFLPLHNHVVLRVGDEAWPALLYYYSNKGAWLSGVGLKKFVLDNHLEEFDVCLVKLSSERGDAETIFDVDIFRVIPENSSPTTVAPF